jgi:hypothetical protein
MAIVKALALSTLVSAAAAGAAIMEIAAINAGKRKRFGVMSPVIRASRDVVTCVFA